MKLLNLVEIKVKLICGLRYRTEQVLQTQGRIAAVKFYRAKKAKGLKEAVDYVKRLEGLDPNQRWL